MGRCWEHGEFDGLVCRECDIKKAIQKQTDAIDGILDRTSREAEDREKRDREARVEAYEAAQEQRWALEGTLKEAEKRQKKNIAEALRKQELMAKQQLAEQRRQLAEDWKLRSQALTSRACELYQIGMFSEAAAEGFKAIEEDSGNIEAYLVTSRALTEQGLLKEAMPLFERQITLLNLSAYTQNAELALRVFDGLPADQTLKHFFFEAIRAKALGWPLTDSTPLLKAMLSRGLREDATDLLRMLLSRPECPFGDCVVLLEILIGPAGVTGSEAGELLLGLIPKPDLQIGALLSILRPMIEDGLFTQAKAQQLVELILAKGKSQLPEYIPLFELIIERVLEEADGRTLLKRVLENTKLSEGMSIFNQMIMKGLLSRPGASELLRGLLSRRELWPRDCAPVTETILENGLFTQVGEAKGLLKTLFSKDALRASNWIPLFDGMVRKRVLADTDIAEVLGVLLSSEHLQFDACVPLLCALIDHSRINEARIVLEKFRQSRDLPIETRLRLEAYSIEVGTPGSEKSLKAFLKEIPYTERGELRLAFGHLSTVSALLSAATFNLLKACIAERYQQWRTDIKRSLIRAAREKTSRQGVDNILWAAEKSILGSPAAFGWAVGILWFMGTVLAIVVAVHWVPSVADLLNALPFLVPLFPALAGILAGLFRRDLLHTAPFREELGKLKSAESSEWQDIVGTRRDTNTYSRKAPPAKPKPLAHTTTAPESAAGFGWLVAIVSSGVLAILIEFVGQREPRLAADLLGLFLLVPTLVWLSVKIRKRQIPSLLSLSLWGLFSAIVVGSVCEDWERTRRAVLNSGQGATVSASLPSRVKLLSPLEVGTVATCAGAARAWRSYTPKRGFRAGEDVYAYAEALNTNRLGRIDVTFKFIMRGPTGTRMFVASERVQLQTADTSCWASEKYGLPPDSRPGTYGVKVDVRNNLTGQTGRGGTTFQVTGP